MPAQFTASVVTPKAKRFLIFFPLISPTTFFLIVVTLVYAFFETFAIIHGVTSGGRARATEIPVYKVYRDGECLALGGSSAQSMILTLIVIALTVPQFRYVERQVQYS